jgi:hypothetical protein
LPALSRRLKPPTSSLDLLRQTKMPFAVLRQYFEFDRRISIGFNR